MKIISTILTLVFATSLVFADAVIFSGADVKALKFNLDLFGRSKVMGLNVNPSSGAGVAAPLASLGMDYLTGNVYYKKTAPNTGWISISDAVEGTPFQYAAYDVNGILNDLPGVSYVDNATTWNGAFFNKTIAATVTDSQGIKIASDMDGQTAAGNFNGVNVTTNFGATTATAINNINPFGFYGTLGANLTSNNFFGFEDAGHVVNGAILGDYYSFLAAPIIDIATLNTYRGFLSQSNIGSNTATHVNGYVGAMIADQFAANADVDNAIGLSINNNAVTGSVVDGYSAINVSLNFDTTMGAYRGIELGGNFGQNSATAVNNHIDFQSHPSYQANGSLDSYTGLSMGPTFVEGSSVNNVVAINYNMDLRGTVTGNVGGFNSNNNLGNGTSPVTINNYNDMNLNPNFGANLTLNNYQGLSLRPNVQSGATVSGNVQMMNIGINAALPISGTAQGINIDMSNFQTASTPSGLQVNVGGTQLSALMDTGIYPTQSTGGPYGLNNIGGQLHIASGFPITGGNFGIGNNLGIGIFAEDDIPVDTSGLRLGFLMNGFLTQIGVAATKTVDSITFMGAGAQDAYPGGSTGTFEEINLFRAIGILPTNGSTINNIYGFKVDSSLTAASPVNAWGVFVDDATAENYFAKSIAIETSTKKVSNSSVGFEIGGTTKALRLPFLTTAQKNALTPLAGMLVWDDNLLSISYNNGTSWVQPGSVTSVGFSVPASSIFGATGSPVTTSGTLGLTVTGTSGGIPYFDTTSTLSSSAALAANALVIGGGAGVAPSTLGSLGTTTTVLHGNAAGAPTFGAVSLTADVSGTLPIANGGTNGTTPLAGFDNLSPLTTKGDVLTHNGTNNVRQGVGTDGYVLTADSTQTNGIKWAPGSVAPTISSDLTLTASDTLAISTTIQFQIWRVQGNSAAIDMSTTPFGASAPLNGAEITIIGNDNDNTVTFLFSDVSKGYVGPDITLGKYDSITVLYEPTLDRYILKSRSN